MYAPESRKAFSRFFKVSAANYFEKHIVVRKRIDEASVLKKKIVIKKCKDEL